MINKRRTVSYKAKSMVAGRASPRPRSIGAPLGTLYNLSSLKGEGGSVLISTSLKARAGAWPAVVITKCSFFLFSEWKKSSKERILPTWKRCRKKRQKGKKASKLTILEVFLRAEKRLSLQLQTGCSFSATGTQTCENKWNIGYSIGKLWNFWGTPHFIGSDGRCP